MTDLRVITLSQMSKAVDVAAALYCDILSEGYTKEQAEQEMRKIMQYGMDNFYLGLCCCTNQEIGKPL